MERKFIKTTLFMIGTLFWMAMIFSFSAESGIQSSGLSRRVIEEASVLLVSDFEEWEQPRKEKFVDSLQYPIRKLAHGTEYGILAVLLWNTFRSLTWSHKKTFWFTIIGGILYAGLDEFHQRFVPGRSGQLLDVGIDSAGVILGAIVSLTVWKVRNFRL